MAEDKVVHSFKRTPTEEVRATVREYRGRTYIDLRIYYMDNSGEWRPTRKGIALSTEFLTDLRTCVNKFDEELKALEQAEGDD
ncbi:MAG: transcriptional coactivator p15/PC4 family protein [Deltaproteobacteria bacterium]|nr:transcriptional coactivator p15/PC4 family protein [Deltaproteobacteria bacterium]